MLPFIPTVLWLAAAGSALLWGLDYYLLPLETRAFSDLAPMFSPTGLVGHGLGIIGTGFILLGVIGYTLRKRLPFLGRLGALKHWLQVHIFLCTLGPFFVLLHTTFKFGGLVSISFWSMSVVVTSGIFGRYVYVRIPKTLNGRFLDLGSLQERIQDLGRSLTDQVALPEGVLDEVLAGDGPPRGRPGLLGALVLAVREDVRHRRRLRGLRRILRSAGVPKEFHSQVVDLAAERQRLRQQTLLLNPFQRLFRYWHVIHLPLAAVMFLILCVHVAVSIMFGYTWIF